MPKPDQLVSDEYDFPARQEHNGQGRWISPDPMRGTGNKYAYADNNPLSKVDLQGLMSIMLSGMDLGSADAEFSGDKFLNPFSQSESSPPQSAQTTGQTTTTTQNQTTASTGTQTAQSQQQAQAAQAQAQGQPAQNTVTPQAQVVPYDTHGATASDAMTNAETTCPNKPFAGSTNPGNVSVTPGVECFGGICTAYVSQIDFGKITISARQWAEFSQASASEQAAWTSALSSLYRHENGHVKDALDIHVRERTALEHLGATGNSPERALQNLTTKIHGVENRYTNLWNQWSASYDQRTCHGTCQY